VTRLERLEGLSERAQRHVLSNTEGRFLLDALPDLLRLARVAAKLPSALAEAGITDLLPAELGIIDALEPLVCEEGS
jgi:hypothetical protein